MCCHFVIKCGLFKKLIGIFGTTVTTTARVTNHFIITISTINWDYCLIAIIIVYYTYVKKVTLHYISD